MLRIIKLIIKRLVRNDNKNNILLVNYVCNNIFGINNKLGFSVHYTTQISSVDKIIIHGGKKTLDSFAYSGNCYFSGYSGIEIHKDVLFAPGVKLISSNHDSTKERNPINSDPIEIKSNVWLGTNSVVLPGVQIGENSIVAAGAVVTKSVPANKIVAGVPARIISDISGI